MGDSTQTKSRAALYCFVLILGAVAYLAAFAFEYLMDPMGRSPQLDADENLAWVRLIQDGALPPEPLYRALLYPWLLSLFGLQGALLAQAASAFGVLCHCMNAFLVGLLSRRLWGRVAAGWLSGLVYSCYPVAMYFSVQVLDITFAMTLFLAALYCVVCGNDRRCPSVYLNVLAGLLVGGAILARPNFLLAAFAFPFAPFVCGCSVLGLRRRLIFAVVITAMFLLPLIGQGVFNLTRSGEFRMLPWQGAYNLLTANKAGANGKFYVQQVAFADVPSGSNPNRMESEHLYRMAHSAGAADSIDQVNGYWRQLLLTDIQNDPIRWAGLMLRKTFYLLNDWEQYNNFTYAFHKERFVFLNYNPLGWGLLFLVAAGSVWLLRGAVDVRVLLLLTAIFALYAAGVLLFYASARFRLPIVPFLTILCGGLAAFRVPDLKRCYSEAGVLLVALLLLGASLVYGDWFNAKDQTSFIQDELLLANAATQVGHDAAALGFAEAVLLRDPIRQEARRIQLASLFNLWLTKDSEPAQCAYLQRLGAALRHVYQADASSMFIAGVYNWQMGEHASALASWRAAVQRFDSEAVSSARALQAVGDASFLDERDGGVEQLKKMLNR